MREPGRSGGERSRRAARRTGCGPREIPRIARLAEDGIEGVAASAEFRRVRFRVDDAVRTLDLLHGDVGSIRNEIGEDRRAECRPHTCDTRQILDRYGQPRENSAFGNWLLHHPVRVGAGALEAQGRKRVDLAVHGGDALLQRIETIVRCYVAGSQTCDEVACGRSDKLFLGAWSVCHRTISCRGMLARRGRSREVARRIRSGRLNPSLP